MAKLKIPRKFVKVFLFLTSWIVTLIIAVLFIALFFGSLYALKDDAYSMVSMMALIVTTLLFTVLWLVLAQFRERLFVKYARFALITGIAGLVLVLSISMIGVANRLPREDSDVSACSSLQEQFSRAQAATYPIATDLGSGTAFAIDADGTLLTAYHVVEGAKRVYVNAVEGETSLKVVAKYPKYDVALLKMNKSTEYFMSLSSKYEVSDELYALGYPRNGLEAGQASLSGGVLSRVLTNGDLKLNSKSAPSGLEMIQTDTAVNPGNSGGPLFNKCGVVGVVTAKSDALNLGEYGLASEEGVSFAVSSKSVAKKFKLKIHN